MFYAMSPERASVLRRLQEQTAEFVLAIRLAQPLGDRPPAAWA
ncbi:MAG: hypothetical protein QOD57_1167 [Actinomycetota bacterium]|jgi:hypothetical protein|nr:hypothetical protein [Actinomycetota bacterium]